MVRRSKSGLLIVCTVVLVAALTLSACGTLSPTLTVGSSAAPISDASTATSSTTTDDPDTMTTSLAMGLASSQGMGLVQEFGDAVVSFLNGKGDLAGAQALVAPGALEGLDYMLSLLHRPTACKVMSMSNYGSSNESEVDLLFVGGATEPTHVYVTILVDLDAETVAIKGISPDRMENPHAPTTTTLSTAVTTILKGGASGASAPVIQIQTDPMLRYMSLNWSYSFFTAEAVVLGTVVDVLPLRQNPLADTGEHQPIVYKGYVMEVEKAYGPESVPGRIIIYALGNGTIELDGTTYKVQEEFPLDVSPGDRLFIPLMKVAYFGTPELEADEYWVQANWAAFAVDSGSNCTRVTGADIDREVRSEFPLSLLEDAALKEGKKPSVVH